VTLEPLPDPRGMRFTHGADYGIFGGPGAPMIEVEVAAVTSQGVLRGQSIQTTVLVDSGAEYTLLDRRWIRPLGLHEWEGVTSEMDGVGGGKVNGRLIKVLMGLSGGWLSVPVIFCDNPKPALLGREGAFEALWIAFLHGERRLLAAVA